jgi:hypothetical protein
LAALAAEPALRIRPVEPVEYRERLESELSVIGQMGYEGYFLVVADFIRWAREQGIPVGPGSGAASAPPTSRRWGFPWCGGARSLKPRRGRGCR